MSTEEKAACIRLDLEGPVAIVTFDRPEKLNALDMAVLAELDATLDRIERDDAIRVVIFTGTPAPVRPPARTSRAAGANPRRHRPPLLLHGFQP